MHGRRARQLMFLHSAEASIEIRTTRKSRFLIKVLAWDTGGQGFCRSAPAISPARSKCARSLVMFPSSPEPEIGIGDWHSLGRSIRHLCLAANTPQMPERNSRQMLAADRSTNRLRPFPLSFADLLLGLNELNSFNPLNHLVSQLIFHSQPQRTPYSFQR